MKYNPEKKLLNNARSACIEFLDKKINTYRFHTLMSGNFSNWESEISPELKTKFKKFLFAIDLDCYVLESKDHCDTLIEQKARELLDYIDQKYPELQLIVE